METTLHESVFEGPQAQGVGRRRSRDAPQGGGPDLRNLGPFHQTLAQAQEGERSRGALSHTWPSGQEGGHALEGWLPTRLETSPT
jgi:hypothetical protein